MTNETRPPFAPGKGLDLLLQTILCEPVRAKAAWAEWKSTQDIDDIAAPEFRLLGEVAHRLDEIDPDYEARGRVMGMKKYVWSNNIHIIRPILPVIDALNEIGTPFLVLKGGGVIAADAGELHRRFIRDIDIMVASADIPVIGELLLAQGWRAATGRFPGRMRAQHFDKRFPGKPPGQDKAEIDLHRGALHFGRYSRLDEAFFDRACPGNLLGRPVRYPSANDRALIATAHGLIWNDAPTYSWITDAVRAFRAPDFIWEAFLAEVDKRKLKEHARRILGYLEDSYGIGLTQERRRRLDSRLQRIVFGPEIEAAGDTRTGRGIAGRLAMMAAELVRSHAVTMSVPYRTDFTTRMKRSTPWRTPLAGQAPDFAYQVERAADGKVLVRVEAREPKPRLDYDLWQGSRWIGRLKVRQGNASTSRHWIGRLESGQEGDGPFRVTAADQADAV